VSPEQHSLPRSIVLHLLPGAALFGFVLVAAALGIPAILALLVGIALVIVPIELGYLLYQGRQETGRWSVWEVVDYREPLPARRIALWAVPLVAWFIVMLFLSVAVLDTRIADGLFSWYPESVREFASLEGDSTYATWVLVVVFAAAFAINGILGPVVEELYFRGHLLPRIDRFGRGAPVLNAVLFSLYHFWTPCCSSCSQLSPLTELLARKSRPDAIIVQSRRRAPSCLVVAVLTCVVQAARWGLRDAS
jgi:membrane protease YdiL (CAAX protease family)